MSGLVVGGPLVTTGPRRLRLSRALGLVSRAGVHVAVLTRRSAMQLDQVLALNPRGPGRLWLVGDDGSGLVELTRTGPRRLPRPAAESAHHLALDLLAGEGVTGDLVQEVEPGQLPGVLAELLARTRAGRVGDIDRDPGWTVVEHGADPARHRVTETLFTLCSGGIGLRGSVEEQEELGQHLLVAAGVYDGPGPATHLLAGPDVLDLRLATPVASDTRILDLRTGVLLREECGDDARLRSLRFASITEPGTFALRIEDVAGRMLRPSGGSRQAWLVSAGPDGGIGVAVQDHVARDGPLEVRERLVQVEASASGPPNRRTTTARLHRLARRGFDRLLTEQRSAWADRWARVDVRIPADPDAERALRFALFQLWSFADTGRDELAVGARGLTGTGYGGHVFWDSDVFVLPALVTIAPEAADLLVAYRLHRLEAARERARADGRAGARFPWESATDGHDVTPRVGFVGGERVAIATGAHEEHITADVAWSVVHNARWARHGRLTHAEATLVTETARYWASRLQRRSDGAHIEGVIGPDEYHERVDDNAYTNVMARWNLREALRRELGTTQERRRWARLADALVDGYDAGRGVHEQFRGYFGLEDLLVRDLAEPPVAADVLAGRARIAGSQVIKQPDVLMLHQLVPDEVPAGSLARDYELYAPRTAHGSSLSPALMACVAARAHRADEALELLRLSLRIDLDDIGDMTAAGIHLGACGGAWQAVIAGFLGARVVDDRLELDPVLPTAWPSLEVRFRCAGRDVHVTVDETVTVSASAPLTVRVTGSRPAMAGEHVRLTGASTHDTQKETTPWAPSPS